MIEINKVKHLADRPEELQELLTLMKLVKEEAYHWQFWKQGLIMLNFFSLVFMNLLIKNTLSHTFNTTIECVAFWYWGIQLAFIIECVVIILIAVKWNNEES